MHQRASLGRVIGTAFAALSIAVTTIGVAPAAGAGPLAVTPATAVPCPNFRDVRRPADIYCDSDLGGTGHFAVNFTGGAGSAGDTWITVADATPGVPDADVVSGSVNLSADVLIHPFNNRKGAGLLALFNEGAGQKGLALIPTSAGNTDTMILATIDATTGKLTTLASVRLCDVPGTTCTGGNAGLDENVWYQLSLNVGVSGDALTATASIFKHTVPTDPDSVQDGEVFQVPGAINFAGSLAALGLQASGQIGIVANATSAIVDSSVTNFGPTGCPIFPVTLMAGFPGVFLPDATHLSLALPINNVGLADANSVQLSTIALAGGVLASPALPHVIGTIPAPGGYVLNASFTGGPFVAGGSHLLTITGTHVVGATTYCFTLRANIVVPPGAPGSDTLDSFTVPPNLTAGPHPHFDRIVNPNVNLPKWTVPTGPVVPGDPTDTQTAVMTALTAAAPAGARLASTTTDSDRLRIAPQAIGDITEFDLNNSVGLTTGTTNGTASTTAEPSGAADGDGVVFVTANWIAAYSDDGGATFTELDPTTVFPADAVGFCCDQIVEYIPSIDRFVWLLQGTGYRLAMASPAQLIASGGTSWTYWNLTQGLFGQCINFDYPDMTLGTAFLYMSWDAGSGGTCSGGFQVARTSFTGLAAAGTITIEFTDPANGAMAWGSHITSNTGNEVFWAGHNNNSNMRIFSLREDSTTYFWRDRDVATWPNNAPTSTTPDGQDWLAKNFNGPGGNSFPYNGVIGATRAGSRVWFGWTAGTNATFAQAHIQIVEFDPTDDYDLEQQVQVWNSSYAFGYPAFAVNGCTGEIGMSFEFGGGTNYENHVVGFWGDFVAWITTASNRGTNRFGDYVTIRRAVGTSSDPGNMFDAFGYGLTDPDGTGPMGTQVDAHYVRFGRPASDCDFGARLSFVAGTGARPFGAGPGPRLLRRNPARGPAPLDPSGAVVHV